MYTRSYNDASNIIVPEHYGGTSFGQSRECDADIGCGTNALKRPTEEEAVHTSADTKTEDSQQASSSSLKLPFAGIVSNILKNKNFNLQKIGKEELLILATAAFLLFSKEGDKECAIMLILLLFLN